MKSEIKQPTKNQPQLDDPSERAPGREGDFLGATELSLILAKT
jgi:hypothetical protein